MSRLEMFFRVLLEYPIIAVLLTVYTVMAVAFVVVLADVNMDTADDVVCVETEDEIV